VYHQRSGFARYPVAQGPEPPGSRRLVVYRFSFAVLPLPLSAPFAPGHRPHIPNPHVLSLLSTIDIVHMMD